MAKSKETPAAVATTDESRAYTTKDGSKYYDTSRKGYKQCDNPQCGKFIGARNSTCPVCNAQLASRGSSAGARSAPRSPQVAASVDVAVISAKGLSASQKFIRECGSAEAARTSLAAVRSFANETGSGLDSLFKLVDLLAKLKSGEPIDEADA